MVSDNCMKQLVNVPTHRLGNIIDWVLVRDHDSLVSFKNVLEYPGISDHFLVSCELAIAPPSFPMRTVTSRNIRRIDPAALGSDLGAVVGDCFEQRTSVDSLAGAYDAGLRQALDRHAPLVTRRIRDRPSAPWLTSSFREARRVRRRAERRWRKRRLTVWRGVFKAERQTASHSQTAARRQFFAKQIEQSSNSSKKLF